jgi:crotonobetainyl-CoA:carnitine CoA-transferase CaiB-like acyl-CoA transferase
MVFDGLRVLDLASFAAGPASAMILADFGADVIKIEPPGGDPNREVYRLPNLPECANNYAWAMSARNKRSLVLNLKISEGGDLLKRLIATADVLVTNYPPSVRDRLGLAYEAVAAFNPRLIYASLTAHGEVGPEADKPGFDATTYWARSGMADLVRPSPDSPPASLAPAAGDYATAGMLYAAIVTALYRRERTGKGCMVSTSLLANGAWANCTSLQGALSGGQVVNRLPRHTPRNALTNYYCCRDGRWLILSMINEAKMWPRLASFLGIDPAIVAARFGDVPMRRQNAQELVIELDQIFGQRDSMEWKTLLEGAGLTASVVVTTTDAARDKQMLACGAFVAGDGVGGSGLTVDSPFWLSDERKAAPRSAPELGQHTMEILSEFGTTAEIERWRDVGAVI